MGEKDSAGGDCAVAKSVSSLVLAVNKAANIVNCNIDNVVL